MSSYFVTGHRPEKLPNIPFVRQFFVQMFTHVPIDFIWCGMAAGTDLIAADVAIKMGVPIKCAIPWIGHKPRKGDEDLYKKIARAAGDWAVAVDDAKEYPGPWVYQKRNEFMVDNADKGLAVWDGSSSGTKNCIDYALSVGKNLIILDPAQKITKTLG